ncbi:MAG: hypothetical protein ACLUJE_00060 [Anaerococcus sp.]
MPIGATGGCENRDFGITKVPYNPITNAHTSVKIPSTFTNFGSVINALISYYGIGIRVDGKLIAIDLYHYVEEGKLSSRVEDIVSHFGITYMEISPSGAGLRIIVFASDGFVYDKDTYHIKKGDIKVYVAGVTNRFVLSQEIYVYLKNEIAENTDGLQWMLDKYMKRKVPTVNDLDFENRPSLLSDESVIAKAMSSKQMEKFQKLWIGDIFNYT